MANLIPTGYTSAHVSCDEGQSVWLADFTLADRASYARTSRGDAIELEVLGEVYKLRVDSRNIHRESGVEDYTISAMSPLGFMDAPWAAEQTFHYAGAVDACTAVEAILSSAVTWSLPTWIIPAGALSMANVTPLQAAKAIVEAVGGVIESFPNGDINCRLRDPVNVPDYATAAVDQYFNDNDWVTVGSIDAPAKGFNRVIISNSTVAQSGNADRLEGIADKTNPEKALIRAYLSTQRAVGLVHTGAAETVIVSKGVVIRTESEVIEFIDGKATLKYPALALTGYVWQHTDLGIITVDGTSATASNGGYSLAAVTYTVQTTDWDVSLALAEEVQFLLVDA
ncbi:MAG: hypothetical protein M0R47_19835 [Methylobacter sp.]|uniref:hypothetical protein n=1 Tax=Methylobacter sp. TaxID=2051955 RepID=UPI0025DB7AB7|nr:hypothetical protein [Methylobacter sp.]MCK9622773.1 hypothetical protein [Methylobacter sp.]